MNKKIYFENLDSLRFICFLLIFFYHSFSSEFEYITDSGIYYFITRTVFANGNIGVNFFFVLSGFLITYLLIVEKKMNGQIDIKKFWMRRILRIWPLFFACVFFGFYVFPFIKSLFGEPAMETASIGYYLTFTNNFNVIQNGFPDASNLGVLWSIAIEEQFYLIWPIILYFTPIKKYWIPFSIVILSSLVFRGYYNDPMMNEYHTLSCIGDMAVGAFGAWAISEFSSFKKRIENLSKISISIIYILFISAFFLRDEFLVSISGVQIIERLFFAVLILLIILEQSYSLKSFFKLGKIRLFSKLGVISYGMYCLHFIGILVTLKLTQLLHFNTSIWQVFILETTVAFAITIVLSKLSYRFLERPFLKLKDKFTLISKY